MGVINTSSHAKALEKVMGKGINFIGGGQEKLLTVLIGEKERTDYCCERTGKKERTDYNQLLNRQSFIKVYKYMQLIYLRLNDNFFLVKKLK